MIRTLRSIVRHRKNLVRMSAGYINRMQKALELMNIKIHTIISDIDGKTGRLIIEAILKGEINPEVLADLRDKLINASREDIIKSLEGNWTPEHLFELKQCYQLYCYHQMIDECDKEIEKQLIEQLASKNEGLITDFPKVKRKTVKKNRVDFELTSYIKEIIGVDITEVVGLSEITVLSFMSEIGLDMTKFRKPARITLTAWLFSDVGGDGVNYFGHALVFQA
jgi:transposase